MTSYALPMLGHSFEEGWFEGTFCFFSGNGGGHSPKLAVSACRLQESDPKSTSHSPAPKEAADQYLENAAAKAAVPAVRQFWFGLRSVPSKHLCLQAFAWTSIRIPFPLISPLGPTKTCGLVCCACFDSDPLQCRGGGGLANKFQF